jgi:large subunit ribosomal protein L35
MARGTVKNKTHKATVKRFKVTASGKLKHYKQMDNSHLKTNKSTRTLRRQEGTGIIASRREEKKLKNLMLV